MAKGGFRVQAKKTVCDGPASGDTPGFESARRTRREETMRRESRKQRVKLNPNPFGLPRPGYLLHARLEPRTLRVKGSIRVRAFLIWGFGVRVAEVDIVPRRNADFGSMEKSRISGRWEKRRISG